MVVQGEVMVAGAATAGMVGRREVGAATVIGTRATTTGTGATAVPMTGGGGRGRGRAGAGATTATGTATGSS